jgi:hypothetical protein
MTGPWGWRVLGIVCLAACSTWSGLAQDVRVAQDEPSFGVRRVTAAQCREQLGSIQDLLRACAADGQACDATRIGDDDTVTDGGFTVHWEWLRGIVAGARGETDAARRQDMLRESIARVDEQVREASTPSSGDAAAGSFQQARADADRVLAQAEFRQVSEASLWGRAVEWFWAWVYRMFQGTRGMGRRMPWLGPLLEWGFVALVGAGVLLWVLRAMRRQRLVVAVDRAAPAVEWQEVSRRWAEIARQAADHGDWREAVHALYWASVVELEGRKVLRQHRGRTPREYLRLLEPGSRYRMPVERLTRTFERIWYGLRPAERADYERVLAWYEEVRAV